MASDVKISDALANKLLEAFSLKELLDGGFISVYGGTVPATADTALNLAVGTGVHTRLVQITAPAGAGLTLLSPAAGRAITKTSAVWSGINTFVGKITGAGTENATFFRWHPAADVDGGAGGSGVGGSTDYRIQGLVSTSGADLNLTSISITDNGSATTGVSVFEIRVP